MKRIMSNMMVVTLLLTIGLSADVSAQEVEGKVIQDYARLMGKTFEQQEAKNADLASKRQVYLDQIKVLSDKVDNAPEGIGKIEAQTDLTAVLVDSNQLDMQQVTSTINTCVRAFMLTKNAGAYLEKGSVQSETIKKQLERNRQLLSQAIPVVNSLKFTTENNPERVAELKKSLIMLAECNEMAELNSLNTPAQIQKMMRQFEDTISNLNTVKKLLEMERSALIVATHAQLIASARMRLEAFVGGGAFNDVALNMTQTIKDRRGSIGKIIPDFNETSAGSKIELGSKWDSVAEKYSK